jgi:hypothetical protein
MTRILTLLEVPGAGPVRKENSSLMPSFCAAHATGKPPLSDTVFRQLLPRRPSNLH